MICCAVHDCGARAPVASGTGQLAHGMYISILASGYQAVCPQSYALGVHEPSPIAGPRRTTSVKTSITRSRRVFATYPAGASATGAALARSLAHTAPLCHFPPLRAMLQGQSVVLSAPAGAPLQSRACDCGYTTPDPAYAVAPFERNCASGPACLPRADCMEGWRDRGATGPAMCCAVLMTDPCCRP